MRSGVATLDGRLFDLSFYGSDYERELIEAVRTKVETGDDVVIVGGGKGVATVVAARRARHVHVYEASIEMVEEMREILPLNDVEEIVDIHHAAVGKPTNLFGEMGEPDRLGTDDLPSRDVLILDCESAEMEILSELEQRPRAIVVESHGFLGATTDEVTRLLEELDYTVESIKTEDAARGVDIISADHGE